MTAAEIASGLLDMVIGLAANAVRSQQESILRQLEHAHSRVLALPSLAADVRAAAEQRRRELRAADDTKPMSTIPPETPR